MRRRQSCNLLLPGLPDHLSAVLGYHVAFFLLRPCPSLLSPVSYPLIVRGARSIQGKSFRERQAPLPGDDLPPIIPTTVRATACLLLTLLAEFFLPPAFYGSLSYCRLPACVCVRRFSFIFLLPSVLVLRASDLSMRRFLRSFLGVVSRSCNLSRLLALLAFSRFYFSHGTRADVCFYLCFFAAWLSLWPLGTFFLFYYSSPAPSDFLFAISRISSSLVSLGSSFRLCCYQSLVFLLSPPPFAPRFWERVLFYF